MRTVVLPLLGNLCAFALAGGAYASQFDLVELRGPSGAVLPHQVEGQALRSVHQLHGDAIVAAPPAWPLDAPGAAWVARFDQALDATSAASALLVETIDPLTGLAESVPGVVSVNGNELRFVADRDGDATTDEVMAPAGHVLRVSLEGLRSRSGDRLRHAVRVTVPVGRAVAGPRIRSHAGELLPLLPAAGARDVDPHGQIVLSFDESMQPSSLGDLDQPGVGAVDVSFGLAQRRSSMPYLLEAVSPYDLTTWALTPTAPFPGGGEGLDQVSLEILAGSARSLDDRPLADGAWTNFQVGAGPGIVNAPIAPEAIYVVGEPGLSVVDLNGFGQSTGNPDYDVTGSTFTEGDTFFPFNPNVQFQGSLLEPPLQPGTSTIDGGSAGVFTLTKNSNLESTLLGAPQIARLSDLTLGEPLDRVFNNAPFPFGCQSGGGNLCAVDGLQIFSYDIQGGALIPGPLGTLIGAGNPISFAPHPNPPPVVFPPLCVSPLLQGQEPTNSQGSPINLLNPGDAFGDPNNGVPPSGLLSPFINTFFQGPSSPMATLDECTPYFTRQQIGQFLYALDEERDQVVVLNSNTMRVLDRIDVLDRPTELATSPNLDLIAVSCTGANSVQFIDTNPASATLHSVVQTTPVGARPRGIAWDSGNEDILVANEGSGTLSILSATNLSVRKTVSAGVTRPFAVAIAPRQVDTIAFRRGVYFAYLVGRDGRVSVFESGPSGIGGIGYDDVIGQLDETFPRPRAIQMDPSIDSAAAWIAHAGTGPQGEAQGRLSRIEILSGALGSLVVTDNVPKFRDIDFGVGAEIDGSELSGLPVDLAFDDLSNLGSLPNRPNPFGAGSPKQINGKDLVRDVLGQLRSTRRSLFLFAAVPDQGVVDVIDLNTLVRFDTNAFQAGVQSVPAPGARILCDYYRQ